jgi:glucokinase
MTAPDHKLTRMERGAAMTHPIAIGIDLGGTQVRAGLVDASGAVVAHAATRTDATGGPQAVIEQIHQLVREVAAVVVLERIAGVGMAAPGPLDGDAGVTLGIPTLAGFSGVPLARLLEERLDLPVRLENDGIAAAFGEWRFGAGRGLRNFVYVTVSTGVGGGIVADGRLLRGRRGMAGHVGHMTIIRDGALCACGNRGCWEAHASGTAFAREGRRRAAMVVGSILAAHGAALDGQIVFEAARKGDPLARALVAEEAQLLGIGIVNLLHLYSPELVVLGGGVSNGFDLLHAGIVAQIHAAALAPFRDVPIVRAALGGNSGLVGAAALILEEPDANSSQ